ncbi:MAG: type II secretion system GspH family protein, partial [Candidatus Gastranaerophilales bacterium]|nr:type II secretion system GspH family protein [Candidatus Gastranaerophilales bacterium]
PPAIQTLNDLNQKITFRTAQICRCSVLRVQPKTKENKKTAFTLAEVLITLVIIGVIAAITIPLLIADYKKEEIKSKVKKDYSLIVNTLKMSQIKYRNNAGLFRSGSANKVAENFAQFIPNSRVCSTTSTDDMCKNTDHSVLYSDYDNKYGSLKRPSIILPDGGVLYIEVSSQKCVNTVVSGTSLDSAGNTIYNEDGSVKTWTAVRNSCGAISFDVNGNKAPNKFGYDAFRIGVKSNSIGKDYWDVFGYSGLESILKGGEPIVNSYKAETE